MNIIKRLGGGVIISGDESIKRLTEKTKADLCGADLYGADLYGANLRGADLYGADLYEADLREADLREADLYEADLRGADLREADLYGADLCGADLYGANLRGANLRGADLYGADLREADLYGANLAFHQFPSIRLLSSLPLGKLSDALTLELMRRDAFGHPHPSRFDNWANGGDCPYKNEERMWHFVESKALWVPGNPEMTDRDLIIAICKEKGWEAHKVDEK